MFFFKILPFWGGSAKTEKSPLGGLEGPFWGVPGAKSNRKNTGFLAILGFWDVFLISRNVFFFFGF